MSVLQHKIAALLMVWHNAPTYPDPDATMSGFVMFPRIATIGGLNDSNNDPSFGVSPHRLWDTQ